MKPVTILAKSTRLSDVQPERVSWLWPGRIPLGKLTILDGDPGNGKSTLTLDIAARVSLGTEMPDGTHSYVDGPAGVVLLSAEDGLGDTIRPRLDAANADVSMITAITGTVSDDGSEDGFTLPQDLPHLCEAIISTGARLVIIDPIMAFLDGDTNSFRDQDVRRALAPLASIAEDTRAAILVVRHLNKAGAGNPLYRGGGSIAFIGAARSGLLVAVDPDDSERRIMAVTKSNLAAPVPSLAYRLQPTSDGSVQIAWEGSTGHTATQLLSGPRDDEERTARDEAKSLLKELLEYGPVAARVIWKEMEGADISKETVKRAKRDLGIVTERVGGVGGSGYWQWKRPDAKEVTPLYISQSEPLRESTPSSTLSLPYENGGNAKGLTKELTDDTLSTKGLTKELRGSGTEGESLSNPLANDVCTNCGNTPEDDGSKLSKSGLCRACVMERAREQ